jgi:prepilin-type N-terminal cleavage/methylation domain-containing protein
MNKPYYSRGFTLIEVMLALLILALGILGISKLQGTLVKNSSDANQRAVAVSLAQKKIDDLRSYAQFAMDGTSDWACPGTPLAAASLAYADIADNTGGAPLCDSELVPNTDILIGNTNYQLTWDVTPYEFVANVPTALADGLSSDSSVDFKNVAITVSWLDIDTGNNASVALSTIVDAYNPALTALSGSTSAGGDPIYPSYTPELAPDVIDVEVDTGDGTKRQTSKPLPDVVSQGANDNRIVTFEVVSFKNHPLFAGEFTQTRREEFTTVDCKCTLSASSGSAYPPAHAIWDDTNKERLDTVGDLISKPTAAETNNANGADEVCTICCRDHHDDDQSTVKYVPGTVSGNHTHYKADGTVAAAGDEYVESCRLKLVDGVLRVFQDWNLIDYTVMNRDDLGDGDPLQIQYASYAVQTIKDVIDSTTLAVKPPLRTPVSTAISSIEQLQGRGIYLDSVYDLTGSESSEYTTYVSDSSNTDRLEKVPCAEVNLTLLADWSSADPSKVTVRNDSIATISDPANDYYGTYTRGEITAVAAAASPGVDVTSSIHPGNEGITNILVNPSPPTSASDAVAIIVSGTATNVTITGTADITAPNGSKVTMNTASCSFDDNSDGPFTCSIPKGDDISISITVTKNGGPSACSVTSITNRNNVQNDTNVGTVSITCS